MSVLSTVDRNSITQISSLLKLKFISRTCAVSAVEVEPDNVGRIRLCFSKIVATHSTKTLGMGVKILAPSEETEKVVKTAVLWTETPVKKAQMPFSNHLSVVAALFKRFNGVCSVQLKRTIYTAKV